MGWGCPLPGYLENWSFVHSQRRVSKLARVLGNLPKPINIISFPRHGIQKNHISTKEKINIL